MIEEGRGKVAPRRVSVPLSRADLLVCADIAKARAQYRQYSSGGAWQRGLLDATAIEGVGMLTREQMSVFVGSVGEYAVSASLAKTIGECGIDCELRKQGDFGVDLKPFGMSIQIKTRRRQKDHSLVRVGTNRAIVACFAEWTGGDVVDVLGWEWTPAIEQMQREVSAFGEWVNIVVYDADLLPMSRLRSELETWKALACH